MAVTHGHGNPNWTRDEVVLALDLYFGCQDKIPGPSDPRVVALSNLLRAFPHHSSAARQPSFRNPDGVAFKLQNLRQLATGRGLGNVSRIDREVWDELGFDRARTVQVAEVIRTAIAVVDGIEDGLPIDEQFAEGAVVTVTHTRRERDPKLRKRLLAERRKLGPLTCDVCALTPSGRPGYLVDAVFEAHHVVPLAAGAERKTKLKDMALLCANCHRIVHRAIVHARRWLAIAEVKALISVRPV